MPGLTEYLRAFNLYEGITLADYVLTCIEGEYRQIKRYEKYEYPLLLLFYSENETADPKRSLEELREQTKKSKVIKSNYGTAYECSFGQPNVAEVGTKKVIITTLGRSNRI